MRPLVLWLSLATRRAGRLFADEAAGLRSRECAALRLKMGRAAEGLLAAAGLRGVTGRGMRASTGFAGSTTGAGAACTILAGAGTS